LAFDPTTLTLFGYPPATGGSWPIQVVASNGVEPSDMQTFTITGLTAPYTNASGSNQGAQGSFFVFPLDVYGDPSPSLTITNNPSWLTLNGTVVSGTPPAGTTSAAFTIISTNAVGSTSKDYSLVFGTTETCQAGISRLSVGLGTTMQTAGLSPGARECSNDYVNTSAAADARQDCLNGCAQPNAMMVNLTLAGAARRRLLALSLITQQAMAADLANQWKLDANSVYVLGDSLPLRVIALIPSPNVSLVPITSVGGFNVTDSVRYSASQKDLLDLIALMKAQNASSLVAAGTSGPVEVDTMPYWVFIVSGLLFVCLACCCFFFCGGWLQNKRS